MVIMMKGKAAVAKNKSETQTDRWGECSLYLEKSCFQWNEINAFLCKWCMKFGQRQDYNWAYRLETELIQVNRHQYLWKMFWNNTFVSLSEGFADITSFPKPGSEHVSLRIAKLFSLSLWSSRSEITMMKTTHQEEKRLKNMQCLNVRVEMHSEELQK